MGASSENEPKTAAGAAETNAAPVAQQPFLPTEPLWIQKLLEFAVASQQKITFSARARLKPE